MSNFEKVCEFNTLFGHPVNHSLTPPDRKHAVLGLRLIAEELCELATSLGCDMAISCNDPLQPEGTKERSFREYSDDKESVLVRNSYEGWEPVETADAIADLLYVVYWAAAVYGIPANMVFNEVHRSNMTKLFPPDSEHPKAHARNRADGKILKGPNYEPPQIAKVLYQWEKQQTDGSGEASTAVWDAE